MPVALVIGGSGGLGREITLTLLKNNCQVISTYHSGDGKFIDSSGSCKKKVMVLKMDLRKKEEVKEMINFVELQFGRLNYVVNTAGVTRDNLLPRYREKDWDEVISVNLTGCFHIINNTIPLLIKGRGGHILIISSISGVKGREGQVAYSAAKGGLLGLTLSAARELAHLNIRVNAVLPGYMKTKMGEENLSALKGAQNKSLLNCLSSPSEVASFIYRLLKTERVTGQVFSLDSRIL